MQLTPLQQPWDGKISNSMDDQEVPRELVLKIKEDFQANGGNKAALEEQYSADVVHRVLGVVKNSDTVDNSIDTEIEGAWQQMYEDGTIVGSVKEFLDQISDEYPGIDENKVKSVLKKLQAKYKGDFQFRNEEDMKNGGDGTEGMDKEKKNTGTFKPHDEVQVIDSKHPRHGDIGDVQSLTATGDVIVAFAPFKLIKFSPAQLKQSNWTDPTKNDDSDLKANGKEKKENEETPNQFVKRLIKSGMTKKSDIAQAMRKAHPEISAQRANELVQQITDPAWYAIKQIQKGR